MTDSTPTIVQWRDQALAGSGDFKVTGLEGWEELPNGRWDSTYRPQGHGSFDSPVWSAERRVIVTGVCTTGDGRDALLRGLRASMTWSKRLEALTITHAGLTLTSDARLTRFKATIGQHWAGGAFGWAAEWVAPDPLRYSAAVTQTTSFPSAKGGLRFPLYTDRTIRTGALNFGARSATGRLVLSNPGTADVMPTYAITGPIPALGFDILAVGTGQRIRFEGRVPAGSTLVIDTATGTAVIDGNADRGGSLTWRDWWPVPAGGSVEVEFAPLGAPSVATLAPTVRPGWW